MSKDALLDHRRPAERQRVLVDEALAQGRSVVVDNTHVTVEARAELLAQGRAHGARVVAYFFATNVEECHARNRARTASGERRGRRAVPPVAIATLARRLVPPTSAEGFDALHVVTLAAGGGFLVDGAPG